MKLSKELRIKIAAKNPMRGKHHTEETKNKMRNTKKLNKLYLITNN